MKKEPLSLYIFRLLVGLGLFIFMCMLYWSSNLIEKNVLEMKEDINQLKTELQQFKQKIRSLPANSSTASSPSTSSKRSNENSLIASNLPNLLQEDPFYEKTLPELLGPDFRPQGILRTAEMFTPQNLHPFNSWYYVSQWIAMCNIAVAGLKFGSYEDLTPNFATRMEERFNKETNNLEYWIFLRDDAQWEPLEQRFFSSLQLAPHFLKPHPVTAHDIKFYYDAFMNPNVTESLAITLRGNYKDLDHVRVIDDFTLVVAWKTKEIKQEDGSVQRKAIYRSKVLTAALSPLPSFVYKYFSDGTKIVEDDSNPDTYLTSSIWAQNFAQHWAKNVIPSCGAWIFDGMTDQQIKFRRNPNFYRPLAALAEYQIVDLKTSNDAVWQAFKSGDVYWYELTPEQAADYADYRESPMYQNQVKALKGVKELEYLFRAYSYIGWNQAKPLFKSEKVRTALTMAIDRKRIIRLNMSNMAVETNGTFFINDPAYNHNITPLPFDPLAARRLLEEEGWLDRDGDGILDKMIDGKLTPFSFKLLYYVKHATAKSIAEYISTALKEVGVRCELYGVDISDISAQMDDKSFDAYMLAWVLGTPPPDMRQIWSSEGAKVKGSSNTVGFASKEADEIIEKLDYESDPNKRIELYHDFSKIIAEQQPYTFLYIPKRRYLYREFIQNVLIPKERQDLIPGATVSEPQESIYWIKEDEPNSDEKG